MDFGVIEQSYEKALDTLQVTFGKSGRWFLDMAEEVRELIMRGVPVTDILVRENSIPKIGILKNFFYCERLKKVRPSAEEIEEFVRTILHYSRREYELVEITMGKKKTLDFSFSIYGMGVFRVNYSSDTNGQVLNIRLLSFELPEFEDMYFPKMYVDYFNYRLLVPRRFAIDLEDDKKREERRFLESKVISQGGLIIHSGETGSGKTTAIASEIHFIANNSNGLIITYENPVEYRFLPSLYPTVRQIEIGKHLGVDEIYYHFLRNSPQVGMIGEIKTREEYLNVLDLASRGHLVITTVHARNVLETIMSFLNAIGEDKKDLFFGVLRVVVSHRLYLNTAGKIVPFYEILFINDQIRGAFLKDNNFQRLYGYLYKDQKDALKREGIFYPMEACLQERISAGLIGKEDLEFVKNIITA